MTRFFATRAATDPRDGDDPLARPNASLGETPLTDPRSVGSSVVLHAVLFLVASFTLLNALCCRGQPRGPRPCGARSNPSTTGPA